VPVRQATGLSYSNKFAHSSSTFRQAMPG
jgi:hypothetical protein